MILVFDASALIALVKRKRAAPAVDQLLAEPSQSRLAHAVNLCKAYYQLLKLGGDQRTERTMRRLEQVGMEPRTEGEFQDRWTVSRE